MDKGPHGFSATINECRAMQRIRVLGLLQIGNSIGGLPGKGKQCSVPSIHVTHCLNRPAGRRTTGPNPILSAHPILPSRSEEHTSELQSLAYLVCRLLLEKKKKKK